MIERLQKWEGRSKQFLFNSCDKTSRNRLKTTWSTVHKKEILNLEAKVVSLSYPGVNVSSNGWLSSKNKMTLSTILKRKSCRSYNGPVFKPSKGERRNRIEKRVERKDRQREVNVGPWYIWTIDGDAEILDETQREFLTRWERERLRGRFKDKQT